MSFLTSSLRTSAFRTQSSTPLLRTFSTTSPQSLAKISLIGRLAATPELTTTPSGTEFARYALGVSTGPRDPSTNQRGTSWFKVANFNLPAEGSRGREYVLGLEKGTLVYVEGEASMNSYVDKDSGKNVSALNILQRSLEVLKRPQGASGGGFEGGEDMPPVA